ncbi:MAG: histidine phosphatase family protein [Acidimicrobiales bacterium]
MLIIARHGQTVANADYLISGRTDVALTDLGRLQAAAMAAALPEPARVIASPLTRARETAEAFGRAIEVDDRWVELDYGDLEGRPVASVGEEIWAAWQADTDYAPPGGESLAAVAARVSEACDELVADASRRNVVVVTHVSPIKAAVAWVLSAPPQVGWRLFVEDAAVCRIAFGPRGPMLTSFNQQYPPGAPPPP